MANRGTQGQFIVGQLAIESQFSAIAIVSASINPAKSGITANSSEDRTYTTGLSTLGLKTGDAVVVNPMTAFTSAVSIAHVRISADDTLAMTFANPHSATSTGLADTYIVAAFKRG